MHCVTIPGEYLSDIVLKAGTPEQAVNVTVPNEDRGEVTAVFDPPVETSTIRIEIIDTYILSGNFGFSRLKVYAYV